MPSKPKLYRLKKSVTDEQLAKICITLPSDIAGLREGGFALGPGRISFEKRPASDIIDPCSDEVRGLVIPRHFVEPVPGVKPKKRKKVLRLYVWEGVLSDYTSGMAVALASSVEDARAQLKKKMLDGGITMSAEFDAEPLVVSKPAAFYVYGGG